LNRTMKFFVNLLRPNFANDKPLCSKLEKLLKNPLLSNFNNRLTLMIWLGSALNDPRFRNQELNANQIKILLENCRNMTKLNLTSQTKLTNPDLPLLSKSIVHLNLSSTHGLTTGAMELLKESKIETLILNYCDWFQDEDFNNLPDTLTSLTLFRNEKLNKISKFPNQLTTLVLKDCQYLEEIPENWPKNLKNLDLSHSNEFKSLPKKWPDSLIKLSLSNWNDKENLLPEKWPPKLRWIALKRVSIITHLINQDRFPPLPSSLEFIDLRHLPEGLDVNKILAKDYKNLKHIALDLNAKAPLQIDKINQIYQSHPRKIKITLLWNSNSLNPEVDPLVQKINQIKLINIELDISVKSKIWEFDYAFDHALEMPN
jgi:hypothetical protein